MPTKPHYILTKEFIVVTFQGKPHTVYKDDARFNNLYQILAKAEWSKLETALSTAKVIEKYSFGKIKVYDGEILMDGKPVHNSIVKRIFEFMSKNHPFEHLVMFLDKLMENPSERSREQLYGFLDRYKLPIDKDGDFIGFKSVTKDFLDHHSRKIKNTVGSVVKVDRSKVSDDAHCGCHFGLHIGELNFVKSFASDSNIILCKVNPKNVVSIPFDSNCAKMRVCEYKVVGLAGDDKNVQDFNSNHVEGNLVTKNIGTDQILGANRAYEVHKEGKEVLIADNNVKAHPHSHVPRSFFRAHKNWRIEPRQVVENSQNIIIGANRAYELHKQGAVIQSKEHGIIKPQDKKSRAFFRQGKGWTVTSE